MWRMLADVISQNAERFPDGPAFIEGDDVMTWCEYADRSDAFAAALVGRGFEPGDRIAVLLPDGPVVHAVYVGLEKAGLVIVGIGPRAGEAEIRHLLGLTGACALVSHALHRDADLRELFVRLRADGLPLREHLVIDAKCDFGGPLFEGGSSLEASLIADRRLEPDDLWLLNSTSGTTGMPKCVQHHQGRWHYFHELALKTGELCAKDVFMSVLPAPFGFGIWTAHITPALLGAPTVLLSDFGADDMIECIERHAVSVLAAVSTQFVMFLNSPILAQRDVSSLRALFTGGERVPTERAAEFEERTGAFVLQFYGSNETGALSGTSTKDSREIRLTTAGYVIEDMQVRLYDEAGHDVTSIGEGQAACRGPANSHGYFEDVEANAKLFTADGWMLTGDIATLDDDGVLRVVGRVADFIIRGGKNISGSEVERLVMTHPAVMLAAAVAMPDPVFGERVCVFVELSEGSTLNLVDLTSHLADRGVGKEVFPERLEVVNELPRSPGGKIAKGRLRDDIRRRIADKTTKD